MVSGSEGDRRIGPDSLFRENDGLLWERHLSGDPSLYGAPMSHGHRVDGRIRATGKLASRNSYCSSLTISEYGLVDLADTTDEVTTDYNRKVASEHQASSYSLDRNKAATGLLHNCAAAHDSSQAWGGRHECKAEPDCVQDPKHAACTGVPRCKAEQPWSSDESKLDLHFERKAHCRSLKSAFEKAMVDSWYGKVSYPGETLSPVKSGYGFEDCLVIVDGLVDHDEEFTSQKGNFPSLNHTKNPYYEALSNLLHLHCWTNSNALKQQLASEKASPGIAPDVVACDGGRDLDLDRDVRRTLSDLSLKAWEPVTGGKCERLQGVLQSLEQWWSSQYERMKHVSDRSALLLIADHQACLPFLLQHRFRVLAKSTMTLVEQPRSLSPRGSLSDSEGEKDMDLMGDGLDPGDPQLQDYQDLDHPQTPFYAIALNDEFADFTSPEYWKKVARRYVGKPKMVLKEWLFAHFDSPYPSDEDKAVLSEATGMGKTQVGNWFINARVRIWRPMIMEMGEDIEGDTGTKGQNTGLYVTGTQGDLQLLPRQPTSPSRHPSTLKPPKVKHDPYPPVTNPPTIVLTRLAPRGKAPPGFSRDGGESFGTHCCEGVVEGSDGEVGEVIVMDAKEQMEDCTLAQPTPQKRPRTSADTGGAQRQHVVETPWEQPQDPSSSSLGASAAAPTSSLHLNHGFAHLYSLWQEG